MMVDAPASTLHLVQEESSIKAVISKRQRRKSGVNSSAHSDYISIFLLFIVLLVTIFTYPSDWTDKVSTQHVFYYGWLTAISTGLGVVPFFFLSEPDKQWVGISNGNKS